VYLAIGVAGRQDVRSVDERVMRTPGRWENAGAAYRSIVMSSVKNSTLAIVLEEDPRKPSSDQPATLV